MVNVSTRPVWSLVASGFVFPSWANVGHLAAAVAASYVIETGPGADSKQAALSVAAGHIGVSWAMASVHKTLIARGKMPAAAATISDDVGASYLSYAGVSAAAVTLARRGGAGWRGQIAAMALIAGPAMVRWCQAPNQTNLGHCAAAAAGGLTALVGSVRP